jgi:hypothetical protein
MQGIRHIVVIYIFRESTSRILSLVSTTTIEFTSDDSVVSTTETSVNTLSCLVGQCVLFSNVAVECSSRSAVRRPSRDHAYMLDAGVVRCLFSGGGKSDT